MNCKRYSKTLILVLVVVTLSIEPSFASSVTFQKEYTYQASETDSKLIYVNCGIAYMEKGQYDLAIRDFDEALRIDPRNASAYINRGLTYLVQGQHDLAIRDYGKAIEIDPSNANAYHSRCIAYSRLGLDQQVIKDLRTSARLGNVEAKRFLASERIDW